MPKGRWLFRGRRHLAYVGSNGLPLRLSLSIDSRPPVSTHCCIVGNRVFSNAGERRVDLGRADTRPWKVTWSIRLSFPHRLVHGWNPRTKREARSCRDSTG